MAAAANAYYAFRLAGAASSIDSRDRRANPCRMKLAVIAAALVLVASPALAFDLGKVLASPPEDDVISTTPLYEIERCMIFVDAVSVASVFRQPDRPEHTLLAWFTAIVIELDRVPSGTRIRTHFNPGGRKARKRLLACGGVVD